MMRCAFLLPFSKATEAENMISKDKSVIILPGSSDQSATASIKDAGAEVRIVIDRMEPDSADDERRGLCNCEVQAIDPHSGKVLAFTRNSDYGVSGDLAMHLLEAVANGDFDEQIVFVSKQAAPIREGAAADKVKFIISHSGDQSVGIMGEQAEVFLDASGFTPAERAAYVEGARDQLMKAFAEIWEFRPSVRTEHEVRAAESTEAAVMGERWEPGMKVRFGANNQREVEVIAGLFRYSGFGSGTYYGTTHKVFVDVSEAKALAERQGVPLIYWDSEQAYNAVYDAELKARQREAAPVVAPHGVSAVIDKSVDFERVITEADRALRAAGLPGYGEMIGLISDLTPYAKAAASSSLRSEQSYAYAHDNKMWHDAARCLTKHRNAEAVMGRELEVLSDFHVFDTGNAESPATGFVLAFPGASDAEADELVTMLKAGGNTVMRVDGADGDAALRAGLQQSGLDAGDFQP